MLDSDPPVPPSDKITPVGDATDIHADRRPQFEYPNAPLPLQSTFYIPRPPIEQQIFDQLRLPGSLTRIRAPQKMGKTSLLFRVIQEAHNLGYATAVVDFQQAEAAILSNLEALIRWFCCHLSRQLGIFTPFDADWQADTGSKLNCTLYIQRQILQRFDCPVVFFLRHLDALLPYPTSTQEFFSLLRGWFEDARWLETWQKLRLVITHSTDIYVPLKLHQSPFNVGLSVHLPEFNVPQIQALAQAYGLPAFTSVQMQALRQLVGGHPYLVAIALYHLAISDLSLDQLLAAASYPNGIYRHHLGSHWAVLQANPTLLAAIKALLNAAEPLALETTLAYHLESLGLISLKGEHAAIDRQLYRQYFVNQLRIAPCLDFSPLAQTSGSLQQQLTNFEKKNQILEQLLQIDDITQFLNRQTFGLYLTNLWETVIQRQQPLALMIVNIDHLKTYIEAFGHEKGDLCVQKIASLIRSIISQPAEHFARYGMDEFVILLLNTPEPDAHRLAATVQAQVEALNLYHAPQSMGLPLPVVTVSIGMVSGIPEIGSSSNDYLSGANQALEKAIRHGGNTFYAIEGTKIYAVETTAVAIVKH